MTTHAFRHRTKIFSFQINSKKSYIFIFIMFIPAIGVLFMEFVPHIPLLTKTIFFLTIITAIINGTIEEIYWRGLYLFQFKNNFLIGFWFSTIFFGAWHIALYSIKEINYGGFGPLVIGALIMGIIWSYCSRKINTIFYSIFAHITVNILAFTGLYINNGF